MSNILKLFITWSVCCFQMSAVAAKVDLTVDPPEYGVDCSTPIHHGISKKECPFFYDQYIKMLSGCYKLYSKQECDANEFDRWRMNLQQPANQHNYTEVGFKYMKAPNELFDPILKFYEENKDKKKEEKWYRGSTIVNSWTSPSYMVSLEDTQLRGGLILKKFIWDSMKPIIEEWVGHKLEPTSLYGIRVYSPGAVLATHVDRLPLVSSAIINVAQDLDEPWPIEVYDHNGKAYNVTMKPGDIVLYESATVLHGRPFPMKGRSYANVFVHFQPIDHEEMNEIDRKSRNLLPGHEPLSVKRRHGASPRAKAAEEKLDDNHRLMLAAARGELDILHRLLAKDHNLIEFHDENDWTALHEAIRGGDLETVKYLVDQGADLGAAVAGGDAAMGVAKKYLPDGHEIIEYLDSIGAPDN